MRVLVTGASGFVGRTLVPALLAAGHEVRATMRDTATAPPAAGIAVVAAPDLAAATADDWATPLTGIDAVIHLAGIAHTSGIAEARYDAVNHRGTAILAEAAARADAKHFIFLSSIRAQTGASASHLLSEDDVPRPTDAYGRSKLAAEAAVTRAGVPATVLRPVLIYGPGVKGNLATLARLARLPIPLPLAGFANRRSLVNVTRLIDAVLFSLAHPAATAGQTFIVADAAPISLADIVAALRRGAGRPAGLFNVPPQLIERLARGLGRADLWERVGGELMASPARLVAAGWTPEPDSASALARLSKP